MILINKMKMILLNKIKNQINYSKSFTLAFILSCLDLNINDNASTLTNYSLSVFLLSLVAMLCFINILGYFFLYILIQQGEYEKKYPKFTKIINYYKKSTLIYVIIEILICFSCLFLLIISSILYF
jgi:hypothetical protein